VVAGADFTLSVLVRSEVLRYAWETHALEYAPVLRGEVAEVFCIKLHGRLYEDGVVPETSWSSSVSGTFFPCRLYFLSPR
jgi:hypothetical protein